MHACAPPFTPQQRKGHAHEHPTYTRRRRTPPLPESFQHGHRIALGNMERPALRADCCSQIGHTAAPKLPLPVGGVRQLPIVGLNNENGQNWPGCGCRTQRLMIGQPQIAFEPKDLQAHRGNKLGMCWRKGKKPFVASGQAALSHARRMRCSSTPCAAQACARVPNCVAVGPIGA